MRESMYADIHKVIIIYIKLHKYLLTINMAIICICMSRIEALVLKHLLFLNFFTEIM